MTKLGGSTQTVLGGLVCGKMSEDRQAEYEKVALEVDAEMLYLNTVGLRKLGVWLGIRGARLEGRGRVDVLRDVRSYLVRSSDTEESLEGKTEFLTRMREEIRRLMEEPDNWEQTPVGNRGMMTSGETASERSIRFRPIPQQRPRKAIPQSTPMPKDSGRDGTEMSHVSYVSHAATERPVSVRRVLPSIPASMPALSLTMNSVPPWSRGGQDVVDRASVEASLRRRVEEDRQRQTHRHTVSYVTDSDDTQGRLFSESGDEGDEHQRTYSINGSEAEDDARIQTLQNEISRLKLKRKRIQSSKSSSSGSSTQRVPQQKLSRKSVSRSQQVPQSKVLRRVSESGGDVKKNSVADWDGNPGSRRKVGVSGPGRASN